jgi:hypothetical protein
VADRLDVAERFMLLDCVSTIAREGPSCISQIESGKSTKSTTDSLIDSLAGLAVDWDVPLRTVNSWFDRSVAIARNPTRTERLKALDKFGRDLREMYKSAKNPRSFGWSLLGNPRRAVSERIGQILVGLLLPAFSAAHEAEDRMTMQGELTKLAFALAAYRADEGSYPAKLADLVPKYVKETPKDIFNNDADLHYTREGHGYLLYSVGSNGKDDAGKGQDDCKNNEGWDDLAIRMSLPAKP